ncbi:MAG TPA: hypothetical protein VN517_15825 [Terriglobales bacterium]|nr:hypothetical protein [Terriglobales bacterium]
MSTKVLPRLISLAVLLSVSAFAVDGTVLINQATVMAAGGFPYKITQSGSYKLSGNIVVTTAVNAIVIDADNVTLDLNGFSINDASGEAIVVFPSHAGITVMNGDLVAAAGIFNEGSTTVRNVSITVNGNFGIFIGTSGTVTGCTVVSISPDQTDDGIGIFGGGLVSGNTVRNFNQGIVGNELNVTNNAISHNSTGLSGGFPTGYGSNTFVQNATDVDSGTSMKNNVCSNGGVC